MQITESSDIGAGSSLVIQKNDCLRQELIV